MSGKGVTSASGNDKRRLSDDRANPQEQMEPPLSRQKMNDAKDIKDGGAVNLGSGDSVAVDSPGALPRSLKTVSLKQIALLPGFLYHFESEPLGEFWIQGGNAGRFTVEDAPVVVRNAEGTVVFSSEGNKGDRVLLEDVIFARGIRTVILLNPPAEFGQRLQQRKAPSLHVVGIPGNTILLKSNDLPTEIFAKGGYLQVIGKCPVYVYGVLESVAHFGGGPLLMFGYQNEDIFPPNPVDMTALSDDDSVNKTGDGSSGKIAYIEQGAGDGHSSGISDESKSGGASNSSDSGTDDPANEINASSTPTDFILSRGKNYHFASDPVGSFRIRAGDVGNFSVDGARVTLKDENGTVVFSQGGEDKDRVIFQDNTWSRTTTVTFIPGRGFSQSDHQPIQQSSNDPNCFVKLLRMGAGIFIGNMSNRPDYVQVIGALGERILIRGELITIINGTGGHIQTTSSARIVVNDSVESVSQSGAGHVTLFGDVSGDVDVYSKGSLGLQGNVGGNVHQYQSSIIVIKGIVVGNIYQNGESGGVKVRGSVKGCVIQHEQSVLQVLEGNLEGNISQNGNGLIKIHGKHTGKIVGPMFGHIMTQCGDSDTNK